MRLSSKLVALLLAGLTQPLIAQDTPGNALTDPSLRGAEVIAFTGLKPGGRIADLFAGSFVRAFSQRVGPSGQVYAVEFAEIGKYHPEVVPAITSLAAQPAYHNVSLVNGPVDSIVLPRNLDVVFIRQNYHDLYDKFMGPADVAALNRKVFAALKPGGEYIVLDHAAAAGSGLSATDTLHRIDPAAAKAAILAAGFVFDGQSAILANPADAHDKIVFDPAVRGHTDQFLYRFRKPA